MIERLKGRENLIKFALLLVAAAGIYLCVAWASYSPLDNAWSVASSVTHNVLNKTGGLGSWLIDLLFAMFGKVAFCVPFALTGVPIYLLALKASDELHWQQVALWCISFSLLMVGLAGLASVLLSNSAAYLSGGFVGAILADLIGGALGQFGTLFVAMLLTAIGFYFCSGQTIIQLVSRLYDWITENRDEPQPEGVAEQSEAAEQAVTKSENFANANLESTPADEAPQASSQLTDPAIFTRPKIIGLETATASENPTPSEPAMTDVSMFKVANDTPLPTIRVPDFEPNEPQIAAVEVEIEPEVEAVLPETRAFPTVRLNPEIAMPTQSAIPSTTQSPTLAADDLQKFAQNRPLVEVEDDEEIAEIEPVHELPQVKTPEPEFLKPNVKVELPEPLPEQAEEPEQAVTKSDFFANPTPPEAKPKVATPVVHPLLQRQKSTEKPTTPLPTLDLLEEGKKETLQITEQEIRETSARIEQELANFGVKATVEDVLVGPVVTRYEIQPAAGVKASKITNLDSDLARSLIFKAIRITDVVPGKPYMGIETPNRQRQTVWLRDVLDSEAFRNSSATLPMALGKDISGEPVVVDMAKMPHLLVAGQTGGGKSVGVNTMILSLLFKLTPEQVRFIMIDPKVVELSVYNDIPHLLTPVVTDMKKAENALRWAVEEMERRYQLVSYLQVRNIEGYNGKIEQAEEMGIPIPNPYWKPSDSMDLSAPPLEKMSYIVLIVDEFADLMMSAGKQVEDHIMRIAQKARAVGIHLILATQRPSTDVITGVIKANIPSRIAFTVASQIDSRTILDKGGAEALLGRGDMLYSGAGSPEIIRVHGAFMSDNDVVRVADNWRARGKPEYIDSIVESDDDEVDGSQKGALGDLDPLFDEIAQFVVESNVTSISGIQRRFSLGFTRAARIVDQLEAQGILSAQDNRGKREVLAR